MRDYVERWVLCMLLCCLIVLLCAGCASEGVGKGAAVQATGIAATTTAAVATVASGGWAVVVGFFAGIVRLLFAQSTGTAPPGGEAPGFAIPWGTVVLLVLVVLIVRGRAHIMRYIAGQQPLGDMLLRVFMLRTDKRPVPPKQKAA